MRQVHGHSRYGSFSAEAQRNLIAIGLDKAGARGYQGRLEPGVALGLTRFDASYGPQTLAEQLRLH